jgi:PiT family inorganic phosphate transporter
MAGSLNLAGALAGTAVAATVAKGIVDSTKVTQDLVLAALVAAISWDLITFYAALPTSSSHALIFGMIGAAVSVHGWDVIIVPGVQKTSAAIVVSPTTALIVAYLLMLGLYWLLRNASASSVNRFFGKAQILSSAWMAFTHGGNDGQKTMGVISLALFAGGMLGGQPAGFVPNWVKFACAIAIALGTATGGYRIIKTMGMRITLLKPVNGFVAETTAGAVIEIATRLGIPISTTHAISGAILGVGATRRLSAVRWGIAGRIVSAWVLTIPGCFIMGWLAATLMRAAGLHV